MAVNSRVSFSSSVRSSTICSDPIICFSKSYRNEEMLHGEIDLLAWEIIRLTVSQSSSVSGKFLGVQGDGR